MRSIHKDRAARILLMVFLLGALGPTIAACNTTAGAGEDISSTGHAITKSAEKNKPD